MEEKHRNCNSLVEIFLAKHRPKGSNRNIVEEIGCFPQIPSQDVLRKSYGCPMLALWKAMKVYPVGEKRPYFQPRFNTTHAFANSIHCNLKLEVRVPRWMALHGFDFRTQSNYKRVFTCRFTVLLSVQKEADAFSARKSRFFCDSQGDVVGVRRRIGDWLELVQDVWWP